jgi:hypothetical protein
VVPFFNHAALGELLGHRLSKNLQAGWLKLTALISA